MAPGFAKKLLAERLLQRFDLGTHGRLGQAQLVAGAADAADTRHGPEVKQMMVIEPIHTRIIVRFFLWINKKL